MAEIPQDYITPQQELPEPEICTIVETAEGYVVSYLNDLAAIKDYKFSLKKYAIDKMACKVAREVCRKISPCVNILYNYVECSLCIFEMNNSNNPCLRPLEEGTTYAGQMKY